MKYLKPCLAGAMIAAAGVMLAAAAAAAGLA